MMEHVPEHVLLFSGTTIMFRDFDGTALQLVVQPLKWLHFLYI